MSQQVSVQHYSVVAFFDGVQLPLVSITLDQKTNGATADLVIEPNDFLDELLARSRVSGS